VPYSAIALQEMNLYHRFNKLYWNTSVLTVNASAIEDESINNKKKVTNYGKIAIAIGDIQGNGVSISLPHINKAKFSFYPDIENDAIVFGLKGINGIGDDVANLIIENRPYLSLADFIEKTNLPKLAMINLIKAGAFDEIEKINGNRVDTMKSFLYNIHILGNNREKPLDFGNLAKLVEMELIPKELLGQVREYMFLKLINTKEYFVGKKGNRKWNVLPNRDDVLEYFSEIFVGELKEGEDFEYTDDCTVEYRTSSIEKVASKHIEKLSDWLGLESTLELYRDNIVSLGMSEDWDKYCNGTISKWEMDSLSFYYHEHEMSKLNKDVYDLSNFFELPSMEAFEVVRTKNKEFKKYQLTRIGGTVLDKNKMKHSVTLLTEFGVVKVKFYQGAFSNYDKQMSIYNEDSGKKKIMEKSWFTRGAKIMVVGYRRDDQFIPRNYANSVYQHSVAKIEEIYENGEASITTERFEYE